MKSEPVVVTVDELHRDSVVLDVDGQKVVLTVDDKLSLTCDFRPLRRLGVRLRRFTAALSI